MYSFSLHYRYFPSLWLRGMSSNVQVYGVGLLSKPSEHFGILSPTPSTLWCNGIAPSCQEFPQRPTEQLCREAGTSSGSEGTAIHTHTFFLKRIFPCVGTYPSPFALSPQYSIPTFSTAISSILKHGPPFVLKLHEVYMSRGGMSCKLD